MGKFVVYALAIYGGIALAMRLASSCPFGHGEGSDGQVRIWQPVRHEDPTRYAPPSYLLRGALGASGGVSPLSSMPFYSAEMNNAQANWVQTSKLLWPKPLTSESSEGLNPMMQRMLNRRGF